jgi:hypothetical protein
LLGVDDDKGSRSIFVANCFGEEFEARPPRVGAEVEVKAAFGS